MAAEVPQRPADFGLVPTADGSGCTLAVRALPGARRTGVVGTWNGCIKIAVSSPAQDGRANEELARTLADLIGCRRSAVVLARGERARTKSFHIACAPELVRAHLLAALP